MLDSGTFSLSGLGGATRVPDQAARAGGRHAAGLGLLHRRPATARPASLRLSSRYAATVRRRGHASMSPPRYRTLDGDELDLPLVMDPWVLVPRALARFDPELAWTLDYEDAPEPEGRRPTPRFLRRAHCLCPSTMERACRARAQPCPVRAPVHCASAADWRVVEPRRRQVDDVCESRRDSGALDGSRARRRWRPCMSRRRRWLWTLRDGISGPDVSMGSSSSAPGCVARLAGGRHRGRVAIGTRAMGERDWPQLCGAVFHLTDDPVGILRAGMALQLRFAVLVLVR